MAAEKKQTILVLGDVAMDYCTGEETCLPVGDLPEFALLEKDEYEQSSAIFGGAFRLRHYTMRALQSTHGEEWSKRFNVEGLTTDQFINDSQEKIKPLCLYWQLGPYNSLSVKNEKVVRAIPRKISRRETSFLPWPEGVDVNETYSAIVFTDLNQGFSSLKSEQGKNLKRLLKRIKKSVRNDLTSHGPASLADPVCIPQFVGVVSTPNLKTLFRKRHTEKKTIWDRLYTNSLFRDRTTVILDIGTLYGEGVNVSSSLSWERTSQDIVAALHTNPALRKLAMFRSLVIRIGVTGAIHSFGLGKNNQHNIYYVPDQHDAPFLERSYGKMFGYNSIVASSVVAELSMMQRSPTLGLGHDSCVGKATRASVQRNFRTFRDGFGPADGFDYSLSPPVDFCPQSIFRPLTTAGLLAQACHNSPVVAKASIPTHRSSDWSIVNESSQFSMLRVARAIVQEGPSKAINQPDINRATRFLWRFASEHSRFQSEVRRKVSEKIKERWFLEAKEFAIDDIWFADNEDSEIGSRAVLEELVDSVFMTLKSESAFSASGSGNRAVELLADRLSYFADTDAAMPNVRGDFQIQTPVAKINDMLLVDRMAIESFRNLGNLIRIHIDSIKKKMVKRPLSIAAFGPPGSGKSFGIKQVINSIVDVGREVKVFEFNVAQFDSTADIETALGTVSQTTNKQLAVVFFDEFDSSLNRQELGWLKMFLGPMEDGEWGTGQNAIKFAEAIFVFAGGTSSTYLDFCREDPSITDIQRAKFSEAKGPDFVSRLRGHIDTLGVNPSHISDEAFVLRRAIQLRSNIEMLGLVSKDNRVLLDRQMLDAMLQVPIYKHGGRSLRGVVCRRV